MDLKEIQKPVEALLRETNLHLMDKVKSDINLLGKMSQLTPVSKGKKIRSTLLFLLAGVNDSISHNPLDGRLADVAAYIEMFHLSSLIHDDIMDNSELRRGQKTMNTNLGNFQSVLWGDYLFINSFASLHKMRRPKLLEIVFDAARLMIEGQTLEVENSYNFNIQMDTYYSIINKKTSSLFAAVAEIAAILAGYSQDKQEEYYKFGLDFGTIFQVSDDMLDIFSKKSGKDRFRDLEEGKITLPYIMLLKECPQDIKEYFVEGHRERLLELCETYNIKELCMEKIEDFHQQCRSFLEPLPESVYKTSLLNLLDFIKYREY